MERFLPPPLNNGEMVACFHSLGIFPCCSDVVKRRTSVLETSSAHSLSNRAETPSGPLAFSGSSSFKSFTIPFFVNLNLCIGGACSPLTSGVLPSSVENTLENCLFNNSAISSSFVYVVSPSTNGVAPTMSDFFDFQKHCP